MIKSFNAFNYQRDVGVITLLIGSNMTIPDQTLTVKQLVDRYARGLPVPGVAVIDVDDDVSDIDRLDRFQRIELSRQLDQRKSVLESELAASKAQAAADKRKAAFDKAVADGVEAASKQPPKAAD